MHQRKQPLELPRGSSRGTQRRASPLRSTSHVSCYLVPLLLCPPASRCPPSWTAARAAQSQCAKLELLRISAPAHLRCSLDAGNAQLCRAAGTGCSRRRVLLQEAITAGSCMWPSVNPLVSPAAGKRGVCAEVGGAAGFPG